MIECIEPNQSVKSGYFLSFNHSDECNALNIIDNKNNKENYETNSIKYDKNKFIKAYHHIMDTSNIYDRKLFKSQFINIYNTNEYKFPLNNNFLWNIINNSIRFTKNCILLNMTDYENRFILREFRDIPYEKGNKI